MTAHHDTRRCCKRCGRHGRRLNGRGVCVTLCFQKAKPHAPRNHRRKDRLHISVVSIDQETLADLDRLIADQLPSMPPDEGDQPVALPVVFERIASPCRYCGTPRLVAEALEYGDGCETCWALHQPPGYAIARRDEMFRTWTAGVSVGVG